MWMKINIKYITYVTYVHDLNFVLCVTQVKYITDLK